MSKLITKARAGVTLVELLVVILIVTILSVSMLPLLQPFVTEAQYAAEAIPVIANMRTKIGVYQYDKGHIPYGTETTAIQPITEVATWKESSDADVYSNAYYTVSAGTVTDCGLTKTSHFGAKSMLDIDYQDLKGKRSRPTHYQYFVLTTNQTAYALGVFGNGQGLKGGTGYAVCELNFPQAQRKLLGTWKRYKPVTDDVNAQIKFTTSADSTVNCFVPTETSNPSLKNVTTSSAVDSLKVAMEGNGWEF